MRQRTATAFIVIVCLRRTRRKDYNLTAGFFINECAWQDRWMLHLYPITKAHMCFYRLRE